MNGYIVLDLLQGLWENNSRDMLKKSEIQRVYPQDKKTELLIHQLN